MCANRHGEGGNSAKSDLPNLADQNLAYLIEQWRQFAEGRRRNEFIEDMIKAMGSDEKVGMILFYSAQDVVHQAAANPPRSSQTGRVISTKPVFAAMAAMAVAMTKLPALQCSNRAISTSLSNP